MRVMDSEPAMDRERLTQFPEALGSAASATRLGRAISTAASSAEHLLVEALSSARTLS
jgi:hypothetical protein